MNLRHFAAALVLFGTIGAAAAPAARGQTLRIAINNDPDILDPTLSRTFVGTAVMSALCDKLFDFDQALTIVPRLATSYEWADPLTLLLRLRTGVTFHDGTPFDAAAVKFNLERHVGLPGSFRRAELGAMDRVEVVDPATVRIVLKQPASPFIATLTDRSGMMVSPTAAAAAGKEFGLNPVCSGPFRFIERVAQDHITLERLRRLLGCGPRAFRSGDLSPDDRQRRAPGQPAGRSRGPGGHRALGRGRGAGGPEAATAVVQRARLCRHHAQRGQRPARRAAGRTGRAGAAGVRAVARPGRDRPGGVQRPVHAQLAGDFGR